MRKLPDSKFANLRRMDGHLMGQDALMRSASLAEAKTHLSELIARVEDRETFEITRRGVPVAVLAPVKRQKKPIDLVRLRAVTDSMPMQKSAGESVREMRDTDRY